LIQYLKHEEIDQVNWDRCLEQCPNGLVYGFSWYLNIVSPGWEALVLGDYEAIMPLTWNRKFYVHYLRQPFFTQQLGVFCKTNLSQELLADFLLAIPSKFRFVEIHLNSSNKLSDDHLLVSKRKNFVLDLNRPYPKIQKGYNSQAKRNLKEAKKAGIELGKVTYSEVVAFYKKHKAHSTLGVKESDYQMLLQILEKAEDNHKLFCRGVFDVSGELLAAGAFLEHQNRVIFLLGNGSSKGRDLGAMTYMMEGIIQQFVTTEKVLDFEGSEIDGIARFFKSFGAEKTPYYKYKRNTLPWLLRIIKH
jgi:hypothetical protein